MRSSADAHGVTSQVHTGPVRVSGGLLDLGGGTVTTPTRVVSLSQLERALLLYLHANRHRPVAQDELLEQVWGYRPGVRSRAVEVAIQRIRAKIESNPNHPVTVVTVRGEGYRWVAAPDGPPAFALVPRLEELVGRRAEVREIRVALGAGQLLTLTGPPGVGKTWLARKVLTDLCDDGAVGWFASLAGQTSVGELLEAVALALGLRRPLARPDAEVDEVLARGPSIGVLDDAQGLDDAGARLISQWVQRFPATRVLVTSHRPLGLEGERRIGVEPLSDADGVELLLRRLDALGLAHPTPAASTAVVRRAGGLPLAIELAVPLLEVLPADRVAATDPLEWSAERPDLPERQRSLGRLIREATAALDPEQRTLLVRFGAFVGAFDLEAAEAIGGARAAGALQGLVRRSLVRRVEGGFELYDAIREWARAELRSDPASQGEVDGAIAAWLVARFDRSVVDRTHGAAFVSVQGDLVRALRCGPVAALPKLMSALVDLVHRMGPASALPSKLDPVLARVLPDPVRADAFRRRSEARRRAGMSLSGAVDDARAGLALTHVDPPTRSRLWCALSAATEALGTPAAAVEAGERAVEIARSEPVGMLQVHALSHLANALTPVDPSRSLALHDEAAALAAALGEPLPEAIETANGAAACASAGDLDGAISRYERALQAARELHHPHFAASTLGSLADLWRSAGRFDDAARAFAECIPRLRELGDPVSAATFEARAAILTAQQGSVHRAIGMLAAAERALVAVGGAADARRARIWRAVLVRDPALLSGVDDDPLARIARGLLEGREDPGDTWLLERATLVALRDCVDRP